MIFLPLHRVTPNVCSERQCVNQVASYMHGQAHRLRQRTRDLEDGIAEPPVAEHFVGNAVLHTVFLPIRLWSSKV